ncbi:MAG: hypothetical protein J6Y94_04940 [Bacteriovoracaceae bacterium]|nr:hypothetical protein [Bacteriovoracaceae bacterium]
MKKVVMILVTALVLSTAYGKSYHVQRVKEYKIHQVAHSTSPALARVQDQYEERIAALEAEIKSLRLRVQHLEARNDRMGFSAAHDAGVAKSKEWFCSIEVHNKTYRGTGATKAVAKNKALTKCEKNHSSFWCNESDVKCEQ